MIRVIGCGNPEAGDDAVGLEVVRIVRDVLADTPGIEVEVAGTGARALDLTSGADGLVVVDAVRTPGGGRPPGTVIRVDVGRSGLPGEVASSLSSHGLGLAEVFGLGAAIGLTPRIVFVGVEARDLVVGHGLSPEVRSVVPALVETVAAEARGLLPDEAPEPERVREATR
ncbi:MAG TPA: hydrogenase maturation protease [Actinomycetota bacterium]|nr:hydrogenase maturation protease [Actinomycetota bacterium]